MILIEIYDKEDLRKNIYAALCLRPDEVFFLHDLQTDPDHLDGLSRFLSKKCPQMKIHRIPVDFADFEALRHAVEEIAKDKRQKAYLEVCGGDELANIYIKDICTQRGIDIIAIQEEQKTLLRWEKDGIHRKKIELPSLRFQEILHLHGGDISEFCHSCPEDGQLDSIISTAEYVFANLKQWNKTNKYIQRCISHGYFVDALTVSAPLNIGGRYDSVYGNTSMMRHLEKAGFFKLLLVEPRRLYFQIRNHFAKEVLITTGSWLEMYIYATAKKSGLFSEVYQSVQIDWDGKPLPYNVINEIDVILMKDNIPVFISCKMTTHPAAESLNELAVYAEEFGGQDAVKVLATTAEVPADSVCFQRCMEMGIRVIDRSMLRQEAMMFFYESLF